MKKQYEIRASQLGNPARWIESNVFGFKMTPTPAMLRGTYAEQIALLGIEQAKKRVHVVPDTLPANPLTGKRYAKWEDWDNANPSPIGVDRMKQSDWDIAVIGGYAMRQVLERNKTLMKLQTQVAGEIPCDSDEWDTKITGTCDMLTDSEVFDFKFSAIADDNELRRIYSQQMAAYCLIHKRQNASLIVVSMAADDTKAVVRIVPVIADGIDIATGNTTYEVVYLAIERLVELDKTNASLSASIDLSVPFVH